MSRFFNTAATANRHDSRAIEMEASWATEDMVSCLMAEDREFKKKAVEILSGMRLDSEETLVAFTRSENGRKEAMISREGDQVTYLRRSDRRKVVIRGRRCIATVAKILFDEVTKQQQVTKEEYERVDSRNKRLNYENKQLKNEIAQLRLDLLVTKKELENITKS